MQLVMVFSMLAMILGPGAAAQTPQAVEAVTSMNIPAPEQRISAWMEQVAILDPQVAVLSGGDVAWLPFEQMPINRNLTRHPASDRRPAFSPDGTQVVFQSDRDGDQEIFVMRLDGTSLRKLTDNQADDMVPAWSPDGASIAFTSDRDGNLEIYRMRSDGSAQQRLTRHERRDVWPTWSPDGEALAFFSRRDGPDNDELYVINSDGNNEIYVVTLP